MHNTFFSQRALRNTLLAAGLLAGLGIATAHAASVDSSTAPANSGMEAGNSDTDITTQVQTKLTGMHILQKSDIHVTTTDGVVTLSGSASSAKAKSEAAHVAKSVHGVKRVDNNLTTPAYRKNSAEAHRVIAKTERVVSDTWITTKVKSDILANSLTKGFDVNVDTHHGVVILAGHLADQAAIDHVKHIAESVHGVKSVDVSGLTVKGQ
ncbi:MAG: BON domain-containing protein [Sulfuriferula sp.]